jgi:diadenosine tetraphosphate (Ap4A) HIT family hydrolase
MKRDRDDTDFREIRKSYEQREPGFLFCEISGDRIITVNELTYVIRDGYPVTEIHTLVIPNRHVASYFELGRPKINACNELLESARTAILQSDPAVTGFNVGINVGEYAGQTIFHCHIHLMPRRMGDVENPRGGVRVVIAGKQMY